jgi:hypothetical protein
VRLNTRALHIFAIVAHRALLHDSRRSSFETDSLFSAIAAQSGFSLFEKFRSAVRKHRS